MSSPKQLLGGLYKPQTPPLELDYSKKQSAPLINLEGEFQKRAQEAYCWSSADIFKRYFCILLTE